MAPGDFFYMLADSAAMADQYDNKAILCSAISAVNATSADEDLMRTFADFTNSYWGPQFGSR